MMTFSQAATGGTDSSDDQHPFDPWVDDPLLAGSWLAQASASDRDDLIALFSVSGPAVNAPLDHGYGQLLAA